MIIVETVHMTPFKVSHPIPATLIGMHRLHPCPSQPLSMQLYAWMNDACVGSGEKRLTELLGSQPKAHLIRSRLIHLEILISLRCPMHLDEGSSRDEE